MNDTSTVNYSFLLAKHGKQILITIHASSFFKMMIDSIDYVNDGGLYMERSIQGFKNKQVNKVLLYCSNDSWPESVLKTLHAFKFPPDKVNNDDEISSNSKDIFHGSQCYDDLFNSSKKDRHFRSTFQSGLKKFCPYVDPQTITPFEVLLLIYVSYIKKVVVHRIAKTSHLPEITKDMKKKIQKFLCTKKGVDIDEKDVPFLNQSNRDPLDFGPNGFGFRNFIASISSEVDDDLLSKASFFVEEFKDIENLMSDKHQKETKKKNKNVNIDNDKDTNNRKQSRKKIDVQGDYEEERNTFDDFSMGDGDVVEDFNGLVGINEEVQSYDHHFTPDRKLRDRSSINKPTSLYLPVKESPTTKIKQQSPTRKTSKNKRKLPNSEQKKQELVTKECDSRMRSKGKRKLRDSIEDEQEVRATKKHKTQVQPDDVKIDNYDSQKLWSDEKLKEEIDHTLELVMIEKMNKNIESSSTTSVKDSNQVDKSEDRILHHEKKDYLDMLLTLERKVYSKTENLFEHEWPLYLALKQKFQTSSENKEWTHDNELNIIRGQYEAKIVDSYDSFFENKTNKEKTKK